MEVIIKDENNAIAKYTVNYEDVKKNLETELKKYDNLLVTEEYLQMAKKSRTELNAMKADIKSRLSEVRKHQLAPYEALKTQYTDALEEMIDKHLTVIDGKIKEIEKKRREDKSKTITEYFNEKNKENKFEISTNQVFNDKWLNVDYSMKKIKAEIDLFFDRVKDDLEIIETFDDEFIIPLRKLYLGCFNMSVVMKNKVEFDAAKKERLEKEAEKAKKEAEEAEEAEKAKLQEELERNLAEAKTEEASTSVEELPEENISEETETLQIEPSMQVEKEAEEKVLTDEEFEKALIPVEPEETEYIEFWVKVTPEQKAKMRELVIDNNIKCGKVKRKSVEDITNILATRLQGVYCDTCSKDGQDSPCDECHRKSMYWGLSEGFARQIAEDINK